ncbi:MAG: acyl-CoA thioesterase, partial [Alphaproteobacteria bacterium]
MPLRRLPVDLGRLHWRPFFLWPPLVQMLLEHITIWERPMVDLPSDRAHFFTFLPIQTRWADMDAYGHVNNMVFYGYIDTAVTEYLVRKASHDKDNAK